MKHIQLLSLLPLLLMGAVVFYFSSQSYKEQTIVPFLERHIDAGTLQHVFPKVEFKYGTTRFNSQTKPYQFLEFLLRKTAHLTMYGLFGIMGYIALLPYRMSRLSRFLSSCSLLVGIAILDEWNQSSRALRTGSPKDVLIDLTGGVIGMAAILLLLQKNRRMFGN